MNHDDCHIDENNGNINDDSYDYGDDSSGDEDDHCCCMQRCLCCNGSYNSFSLPLEEK